MLTPKKLSLASLPTPIQKLPKLSRELGKELYVWRDDLTGFIDSGNKVRKLEYLLADALAQGCDWIVTCGGPQSNHTRATTSIARQLGLGVSLVVAKPKTGLDLSKPESGNLLLNRIYGAQIHFIEFDEYQKQGARYDSFLIQESERVRASGKKPYVIPLGGSSALGCFGYLNAVEEMLSSWTKVVPGSKAPDDLFCALGSCGTTAGLQLGIEKQKIHTRLQSVHILGSKEVLEAQLMQLMSEASEKYGVGFSGTVASVISGYVGEGYALAKDEDLRFYMQFAQSEGVLLDPCYTGKAFQGMIAEIKKEPRRFGEKILFLHSGGLFGNFAYNEQYHRVLAKT